MHLYSCSENRNTALYRVCSLALKITFVRSLEMTLSSLFFFFFLWHEPAKASLAVGGKYKILCVLTRLVALCFVFTHCLLRFRHQEYLQSKG